jgi:hypothetical protein
LIERWIGCADLDVVPMLFKRVAKQLGLEDAKEKTDPDAADGDPDNDDANDN